MIAYDIVVPLVGLAFGAASVILASLERKRLERDLRRRPPAE